MQACASLDITHAESSRPGDKTRIVAEVKRGLGMKKSHLLLTEGLTRAVRAALRWGGSLDHLALYCGMLLQARGGKTEWRNKMRRAGLGRMLLA